MAAWYVLAYNPGQKYRDNTLTWTHLWHPPSPLKCCEFVVKFSLCVWRSQHHLTWWNEATLMEGGGGRRGGASDNPSFVLSGTVSSESLATLSQLLLARIVGHVSVIMNVRNGWSSVETETYPKRNPNSNFKPNPYSNPNRYPNPYPNPNPNSNPNPDTNIGSARIFHLCDTGLIPASCSSGLIWLKLPWSHVRKVLFSLNLPSVAGFLWVFWFPLVVTLDPWGVALSGPLMRTA